MTYEERAQIAEAQLERIRDIMRDAERNYVRSEVPQSDIFENLLDAILKVTARVA